MRAIFVAGTDTGVGKSVVTGLLGRYLLDKGRTVVTQKWVQTGRRGPSGDMGTHLKLMGRKRSDYADFLSSMALYAFKFESSPHLAARLENGKIAASKIIKSLRLLSRHFDFVVIEGTGGLMVPLDGKTLFIDIVERLHLHVLMVAGNRLGVINHALLSIEALKARKIRTLGVIFNNISKDGRAILDDNPGIVRKFSGEAVLGVLPRVKDIWRLQRYFTPIGDKILESG